MSTKRHNSLSVRSAFSLVEMLLVIAIIGILIALLLPALNGARDSALRVSTSAMIADISNAAQRFGNDNAGRSPGYFSQAEMGHSQNADVGMSAMENVMLELGGTAVVLGQQGDFTADPDKGIIELGPRTDTDPLTGTPRVVVNINNIGAEGAYYTPDEAAWVAQDHGPNAPPMAQAGNAGGEGQELMPDLLDAWGNPMLVWSQDTSARGSILVEPGADPDDVYTQFARISSDAVGAPGDLDGPAWFYLNSNAAFLEAEHFSSAGINMTGDPDSGAASTIASGVEDTHDALDRLYTLATLLASPSAHIVDPDTNGLSDPATTFEQVFPSTPRGQFIVQSAGSDGIFFSNHDEGWKSNATPDFHLNFGNNYMNQSNERFTDRNDAFTNIDMLDDFDDILVGTK